MANLTVHFDFAKFQAHLESLDDVASADKLSDTCNLLAGRYHGIWIQPQQTSISAYRQVGADSDVLLIHFSGKDRWVS